MESISADPVLAFRKMLSEKFTEGDIDQINRETVKYKLSNNFHEELRQDLKKEYLDSYQDLQAKMLDDPAKAKTQLINASTKVNFYKMYDVYYSMIMN